MGTSVLLHASQVYSNLNQSLAGGNGIIGLLVLFDIIVTILSAIIIYTNIKK